MIPVIVYVVHYGDTQPLHSSNTHYDEKNERSDLEDTHKIITDEEELQEIAEKENLKRIPVRIEYDYNGPKE